MGFSCGVRNVGIDSSSRSIHLASYPFAELFSVVRDAQNASLGWKQLFELCDRHWPSPLWGEFKDVSPEEDVRAATAWLTEQSSSAISAQVNGFYLGLDTLNMDDGDGANIEIGGAKGANADDRAMRWLENLSWRGDAHLIEGLLSMQKVYEQPKWRSLFSVADYVLFLAYSALILSDAATKVVWPTDAVLAWGFHDGDLFILGRTGPAGFHRTVEG